MVLSEAIRTSISESVLCWLATASDKGIPNVSPKEIFCHYGEEKILIANIASPQSVKNIEQNGHVCVSFIDILVQKGYQLKGKAKVLSEKDESYSDMKQRLEKLTAGKFPFNAIIEITVSSSKPIIAPRYWLYPDTTEKDQIASAKALYKL